MSTSSLKLFERQQKRRESSSGGGSTRPPSTAADPLLPASSRHHHAAQQPTTTSSGRRSVGSSSYASEPFASSPYHYEFSSARPADSYGRDNTGLDTSFASASKLVSGTGRNASSYLRAPVYKDSSLVSESSPRPVNDPYGRERVQGNRQASEYSSTVAPPTLTPTNVSSSRHYDSPIVEPLRSTTRSSLGASPYALSSNRYADPIGRSSSLVDPPMSSSSAERNLATWTRSALESRVLTLEKLLAEKDGPSRGMGGARADEMELSEHLQVTVRKNRELRAELEVTKNRLNTLMEEREAFALKLARDNDSLQSLLEEAQRAKDALGNCIKALSIEKKDLAERLAMAEDEIIRLRASGGNDPIVQLDEVRGNIEDVAIINEGLRESLRQMQLKNPAIAATVDNILAGQQQPH